MLLRFDTVIRAVDFDERASTMQLRPWQWSFLLAADGRTRLGELARTCGIEFETAADLAMETESLGLLEIVTQTLDQYRESVDRAAASAATPIKKVSVSFDSLGSTFGEDRNVSRSVVTALAPVLDVSEREVTSAAVELPGEPHVEPSAHESHLDAVPEVAKKSVSFSLFAPTFGAATSNYAVDTSAATRLDATEAPHEAMHVDAPSSIPEAMSTNGTHAASATLVQTLEPHTAVEASESQTSVGEHALPEAEDAPQAYLAPAVQTHVRVTHEPVAESADHVSPPTERAQAAYDILLQHFPVGENSHAVVSDPDKANADRTGSLLRVLGLKK